LIDAADAEFVGQWRWRLQQSSKGGNVYAERDRFCDEIEGRGRIALHVALMEPGLGLEVDHRDGDGLNCRRGNMRVCTPQQNRMNKRPRSGREIPKGVYPVRGRWSAMIACDGLTYRLGRFDTQELAAAAYTKAALRLHGEFANVQELLASDNEERASVLKVEMDMAQPKDPPLSVRFRAGLLDRVQEYADKVRTPRNAAIQDLIEAGLEADRWAGARKPAAAEAPVAKAEAAVKAKNLPIKRASEMPDAPAREVDMSKLDVQVGPVRRAFGDLLKKGKK
jgi:hypothetical protein